MRFSVDFAIAHKARWLFVLSVLLITGCASSIVVRTLYADLDDRSAERFKQYADFTDRQDQWIDRQATQFHRWHRATQLPLYASALQQLGGELSDKHTLSDEDVSRWEQTVRDLTENVRRCHPLNHADDFLINLSDRQVKQIGKHLRNQHNKFRKRYQSESADERLQRRVANITKWAGRLGASFNERQRALLIDTLKRQHSLGEQRMQLRSQWLDRFDDNLKNRRQPGFASRHDALMAEQWRQTEREYPRQWRENEVLWTNFLLQFLSLQTPQQRTTMLDRIAKFASIIDGMSGNRANAETCA